MTVSKKTKAIDKKIKPQKGQYNLDRKFAKLSALSLGHVGKCEFWTDADVLPEKDLLEKAAAIDRNIHH